MTARKWTRVVVRSLLAVAAIAAVCVVIYLEIFAAMLGDWSWQCAVFPAIPVVLIAALVWQRRTRARRWTRQDSGLCHACGYDRSTLAATAICPECGRSRLIP